MLPLVRLGARAAADVCAATSDRTTSDATRLRLGAMQETLSRALARLNGSIGGLQGMVDAELATIDAEVARLTGEPTVDRWRTALDRWTDHAWPYPIAYVGGQLAAAAAEAGEREVAVAALGDAHAMAARLGAEPLRVWLERTARRLRVQLADALSPPRPSGHAFGLTSRELEVLGLVVAGRTNRQIADELFISANTAGVHVSNILGKLGVASRTEAASTAIQSGLVRR
jgi:ATP/maltotriose-dependent transcriptional regulator MalT